MGGERLVFFIVIYASFISVNVIYISCERVNNLELYTFVVFDVLYKFSDPQQHAFDGHLVYRYTNARRSQIVKNQIRYGLCLVRTENEICS
jgi:hypothetical protein